MNKGKYLLQDSFSVQYFSSQKESISEEDRSMSRQHFYSRIRKLEQEKAVLLSWNAYYEDKLRRLCDGEYLKEFRVSVSEVEDIGDYERCVELM